MEETKKKLNLFDIICLSFASFFSIELVASQATLGPSMIFSMLLFGGLYLICHGLICAEMGAAYPDQGGIYVWTLQAFGSKWAARTTWWYWANVVAFVPCTMVALVVVFQQLFWPDMSVITTTLICIAGTWAAVLLNCMSLEDSKLLSNTGSVLKLVVCLALIGGGIYTLAVSGSQNVFSMPKALLITGIMSISIYILCAIAILIIMPQAEIDSASGMIDAIITVFGGSRIVAVLIGISLVFVYASYIFGWTIGGNSAALEAGEAGELPGWFARSNKRHAPSGPAILLGIASTVLLLVYGFTANSSSELFWTLLAFTSIIFFLPYVVLSFAFLRLRKIDPDTERPFKIPGKVFPTIVAILNFVLLVIAIIGYLLPPEGENPVTYVLILVVGLAVTQIIGEILIGIAAKKA